jgi:hypothetical protein
VDGGRRQTKVNAVETHEVRVGVLLSARRDVDLFVDAVARRQACGENLRRYGTRMDSQWSLRAAYDEARKVKAAQDAFCAAAERGLWDQIRDKEFPESLQWEMLVDVLRGRVKVNNHCYEEGG